MGQLKGILVGIILGALAAGGAAWWMVRQSAPQFTPVAPLQSTIQRTAPSTAQAPTASSIPVTPPPVTPPWASGELGAGKSPAQMQHELQAARAKSERLQKVMQTYQQMMREGKQTDPKAVSHLLDQLQEAEGSSVVNGIDLNVLRNNLTVASQMQTVAHKIEAESQSSHPDKQKIHEYLDELNQLKGQVNRNYTVKSPGAGLGAGGMGAPTPLSGDTSQSGK